MPVSDRKCEACGYRVAPGQPRKRDDQERMVCGGCFQKSSARQLYEHDEPARDVIAAFDRDEQHLTERPTPRRQAMRARTAALIKRAHDSGNQVDIYHCFAGETRYLTREGVKTLAETVGTEQYVLTGEEDGRSGRWVKTIIHSFGPQPLLMVTLKRNKQVKVIRATAEHRWLVTAGPKRDRNRVVTTADLRAGYRLPSMRLPRSEVEPSSDGVRMGFLFGDGTIQRHESRTYGLVTLWGEKRDLSKYFDAIATNAPTVVTTDNGVPGLRYSSGMAGYVKELPPITADQGYLLGWLMGYLAADGSVSTVGQVTLSSAVLDDLLYVRDVATVLGIGTYAPTSKMRRGFGDKLSQIHQMGFSAQDLGERFFLRDDQRLAARTTGHERFGWTVVSVEDHGDHAEVYCPRVPETETFTLEDNIHTGQCPFCGSGQVVGRSDRTVECTFCQAVFTVQVQPMYSAFPQTMNGQPVQEPGAPGMDGEPDVAGDEQLPVDGDDQGGFPPGDDQDQDGLPDEEEDPEEDDGKPAFLKGSMLRTANGTLVELPDLINHMALLQATPEQRPYVLEAIRREKQS